MALLCGAALMAQSNPSDPVHRIKLSGQDLSGYTLAFEDNWDWPVFDHNLGAPADCLKTKPVGIGREQAWKAENADLTGGRLRVDYVVFDSAGQAAAAARTASITINNATEKMSESEVVGDASWRTIAGSPALIVQRGAAMMYLSAQGNVNVSEAQLAAWARAVVARADALDVTATAGQLACDVETYIGLGQVSDAKLAGDLRAHARQFAQTDAAVRRAALERLKGLLEAGAGKGIDRAAAVNLLRAAQALNP